MSKFSGRKLNTAVKALALMVAVFAVISGVFTVKSYAESVTQKKPERPLYLITVSTASSAGTDTVEAFRIHYKTGYKTGRVEDTVVIYPKTDYSRSISEISTMLGRNVSVNRPGLEADSVNYYLVEFPDPVEEITSAEVVLTGKGKGWQCIGFKIARIASIHDISMIAEGNQTINVATSGYLEAIAKLGMSSDGMPMTTFKGNGIRKIDLEMIPEEEQYYGRDDFAKHFLFRLDVADIYKAGLESLEPTSTQKCDLSDKTTIADLNFVVKYVDKYNAGHVLSFPVVKHAKHFAVANGVSEKTQLYGILEQGESIFFDMELPDFASLGECTLAYDLSEGVDKNDSINIAGFSFYDAETVSVEPMVQNGFLRYSLKSTQGVATPEYYFKAASYVGNSITPGGRSTFKAGNVEGQNNIIPYEDGDILLPSDNRDLYMFEITTDSMAGAEANARAYLSINYTLAGDGLEKSTEAFSLVDVCHDYYGFWTENKNVPVSQMSEATAFAFSTFQGRKLCFYYALDNVDRIDSVTVQMEGSEGTWQISSVDVFKMSKMGKRRADFVEPAGADREPWKAASVVTLSRDISGTSNTIASSAESVIVQNGKQVTIPFNSTDIRKKETDNGFERENREISYEEACKDWGFTNTRANYNVTVEVANDAQTDFAMGDPGSENHFYFQLIFESGDKSPIILANQQIEGDAFRAGDKVNFTISCNHDFGDVKKVRVIPDDTSSKSDIFDKLKIKAVHVTRPGDGGVNQVWDFEYDDWIDIKYYDENEKNLGRSVEQIAVDLERTNMSYSMNMEFHIKTDDAISSGKAPFVGNITATLGYINGAGSPDTTEINVTDLLYQYYDMNRTVSGATEKETVSNPAYMYRLGSVDRFVFPISDIQRLTDIEFKAKPNGDNMEWSLGAISVYIVADEGVLRLNKNGEYERNSTLKYLCSNQTDLPQSMTGMAKDIEQSLYVDFTPNDIIASENGVEIHTKTPISINDELGIIVNLANDADKLTDYTKDYTLQAVIDYTTVREKHMSSVVTLTPDDMGNVAYKSGISASSISSVDQVTILASGPNYVKANVSDVVLIQTRPSTDSPHRKIVTKYRYDMGGKNAYVAGGINANKCQPRVSDSSQDILIGFGSEVPIQSLNVGGNDILVRLVYNTDVNPYGGNLVSDYFSLAEAGIEEIATGKTVKLTMDVDLLRDITGIELKTEGTLSGVFVDTVYAAMYKVSDGERTYDHYISAFEEKEVLKDPVLWNFAENSIHVTPVQMTFDTASTADGGADSSSKIRMKVTYHDEDETRVRTYDDIRLLLPKFTNFSQGTSNKIDFMLPGYSTIESIELEPYDDDDNYVASWNLNSVDVSIFREGEYANPSPYTIGEAIYENDPITIGVKRNYSFTEVVIPNNSGTTTERYSGVSSKPKPAIYVEGETKLSMRIHFNNDDTDYKVYVKELSASGAEGMASDNLLTAVEGSSGDSTDSYYVFTAPKSTSEEQYFAIIIAQKSTDTVYDKILVTVKKTGNVQVTPGPDQTNTGDSTNETDAPSKEEDGPDEPATDPAEDPTEPTKSESDGGNEGSESGSGSFEPFNPDNLGGEGTP